jgi:hypothetical protein
MRLTNINSIITFNTVMAHFAPSQSGKMAYLQNYDKSITIFAVETCDVCGDECQGANPITIVKPRKFVLDGLATRKVADRSGKLWMDEGGCDEYGNFVCSSCYDEGQVNKAMLKSEAGQG